MSLSECGVDSVLHGLPLLEPLSPTERELVAGCFEPVTFEFGENVVVEGELASDYFVVVSGRARVLKTAPDGTEFPLNVLGPGATFGERGLVEGAPRPETVRASSRSLEVLRLDGSVFHALMRIHPNLRDEFGLRIEGIRHGNLLRLNGAFAGLSNESIAELIRASREVDLEDGELLFREEVPRPGLYLVTAGRLNASLSDGESFQVHTGDLFGDHVAAQSLPRPRLAALGPVRLLHFDDATVQDLRRRHPLVAARLDERAALVARRAHTAPTDPSPRSKPATDEQLLAQLASEDLGEEPPATTRPRKRKYPMVRQIDSADSSAACIAMLGRYYGYKIPIAAIRAAVGTSFDGTSVRGILRGGADMGIEFRVIKTSVERLEEIELPLILHLRGSRWVVLYRNSIGWLTIGDPSTGLHVIDEAELAEWTGYALIPTPTDRLADAPRGGLAMDWLKPLVRPHQRVLAFAAILAAVAVVLQMVLPVLTQVVIDDLLAGRDSARISLVVAGILVGLLAALGLTIYQRRLLARIAAAIDGRVLDYVAERMLRLPLGYFQARQTADIAHRLEGVRKIRRVLVQDGVVAAAAALQVLATPILLAFYSWVIALLFILVAPVFLVLMRWSERRSTPDLDALEEAFRRYQSKQLDAIRGIEVVKISGAEERVRKSLEREFDGLSDKLQRRDATVMVYDGLVSIATLGIVASSLWAGALLTINGQLTIGQLVAVTTLVLLANAPLRMLLALWNELQTVEVVLSRLDDLHEPVSEQPERSDRQSAASLEGRVRLDGLGFHHGRSPEERILNDISLEVPAGSTVALVGRSGSGKSTLLRCLAGLLTPAEGRIEYDGIDIRDLDLRSHVGVLFQQPFLVDATIAENIALGQIEPDLDRIREAAVIANAAEFVEQLPLGYATHVGELGLLLSTGQQQRLAIARAVYGRPRVLLMDEPTTVLDTESARLVEEGIGRLRHGRTVFIATSRLSTVRDADLICVLEKGQLVESGTHEELITRDGLYRYLLSQAA